LREGEATLQLSSKQAPRVATAAAALCAAMVVGGCGIGPGPASPGEATLTVTRDYGAERLSESTESDPKESETVIRFLDRETDLETRYGGGFVQSIDGLAGSSSGGRSFDWFFYVNGIESPIGAAEVDVRGGDRIWWDYRDWTDSMRVPAVVGSWPEPFLQRSASEDERLPVRIECRAEASSCKTVRDRLADEGVDSAAVKPGEGGGKAMRIVVGPWRRIDSSPDVSVIDEGPETSGVFAGFDDRGGQLAELAPSGEKEGQLGRGGGLVAALHEGEDPPVWVVTGTDDAGVAAAAAALDPGDLRDHYAVAVRGGEVTALPLEPEGVVR
jgi:hypothetical protein